MTFTKSTQLTATELKTVIATLTKHQAWLSNAIEDDSLEKSIRQEHRETLQLIDSAIKKITNTSPLKSSDNLTYKKQLLGAASTNKKNNRRVSLQNAKVLIADDKRDTTNLLFELMQDIGFKSIEVAENGVAAFDKIKSAEEPFDLVLCDWDMPGLNGLEVYMKAKACNRLNNTHFIMVTALYKGEHIRQAIQVGVDDYVVKPIDVELLENKVKTALKLTSEEAN